MLRTPWSIGEGKTLDLYVEQIADHLYRLSDLGQVAELLADHDVDLSKPSRRRAWDEFRRPLATMLVQTREFEIATTAEPGALGKAAHELGSVAMRAAGLTALSGKQRRTWAVELLHHADAAGLSVDPSAEVRNKFGGTRKVAFRAWSSTKSAYVLAAKSDDGRFNEAHDRIKGVYEGAEAPLPERVALTDDKARIEPWHRESLARTCVLRYESEQDTVWESLAA